jgi:hypothetical protein
MSHVRPVYRLSLLSLVLLAAPALAAPAKAPAPKAPAAKPAAAPASIPSSALTPPELRDRVVAVVDEDPILASEIDRAIVLHLIDSRSGEADAAYRRRIVDQLVEQRLRFHEIDRFGFQQVPVDDIEAQVAKIRATFPDDASFRKALKDLGMTSQALRQLVARQLMVYTYVDEQLGARVFVSLDDITQYYRNVLTPQMQKSKQPVPALDDVREQIREVVKQQRLNSEIEKWTQELRRKADVAVYIDKPLEKLPPVVKRIEGKPAKDSKDTKDSRD